ncbi:MAG: hypothetical protein J0M08_12390 [Bacteroidetes bacterium]|nr:hypothetical protein [Bacteroidota bacterium]
MQKETLEGIKQNYSTLLPQNPETILILAALQSKIENQIIEESFTQHDFDETIDEVGDFLQREQSIQKENISKKLSQYYYTTLKRGNEYRYQLTVFARELVQLLTNELEPQFDNIDLSYTFERTLKLTAEDLDTVTKFEYWYLSHFQPAKRVILSHTENLQRLVDAKTISLRELLKNSLENTKELINSFIEIFEALGKQTEGLTHTIAFKQEVIDNIKAAEEHFKESKDSWEKYTRIRFEVERFFENIDYRVLSINDRIQASTSRLKTLYDTLRYKQIFKLKLEKFLTYLVKNSTVDSEKEIKLPENVQTRKIPYWRKKLVGIPVLDFVDVELRDTPNFEEDQEYKNMKEKENMRMLNRQESVTKWLESMNADFEGGKTIDFDKWFKQIYSIEQNLEVPIDVCYGLIQRYGKNKDANLNIESKPFKAKEDLTTWKMKIVPSHS